MDTRRAFARGRRRCTGDDGAGLVEYALLVALIALVCIGALNYFQTSTRTSLSRSSSSITNAGE